MNFIVFHRDCTLHRKHYYFVRDCIIYVWVTLKYFWNYFNAFRYLTLFAIHFDQETISLSIDECIFKSPRMLTYLAVSSLINYKEIQFQRDFENASF